MPVFYPDQFLDDEWLNLFPLKSHAQLHHGETSALLDMATRKGIARPMITLRRAVLHNHTFVLEIFYKANILVKIVSWADMDSLTFYLLIFIPKFYFGLHHKGIN